VNAETDFVARNESSRTFVADGQARADVEGGEAKSRWPRPMGSSIGNRP
jgi:hypothetical protein